MLGHVAIIHTYFWDFLVFSFKARKSLQRQNCFRQNFAQANTAWSRIFREYLRENELLSKTILACLSGVQMVSIHEIKKCQPSRNTAL